MSEGKKKILIIDDEQDFCFFVKAYLEFRGNYRVIIAEDGKKGLLATDLYKPDLILLDIKMPEMDGMEVLRRIKQMYENIDVIMITAVNEEQIGKEAKSLGASDYITKPISMDYLETAVLVKFFMKEQ